MPIMSAGKYAASRGVSLPTVSEWIRDGKLDGAITKQARGYQIDSDKADALMPRVQVRVSVKTPAPDDADSAGGVDYNTSRAKREFHQAALAELEHRQKAGELIAVAQVQKEAFRSSRLTRDAMLNVADRVAHDLAAISDPFEVHARLTQEIKEALRATATKVAAVTPEDLEAEPDADDSQ